MGIFRTNDPTQFGEVDGIIIDERSPPASVQGVPSNIAICVGQFQRGPLSLSSVGSTGELFQKYGRSSASGNVALMNKRFGRLKVIRVAAAGAAYAAKEFSSVITFTAKYLGEYGNNIQVKIANADADAFAVTTVTPPGQGNYFDVSGVGKYFLISTPSVDNYVWVKVTDSLNTQVDPEVVDRVGIEVDILANDTAAQIATKIEAALNAADGYSVSDQVDTTITITREVQGAVNASNRGSWNVGVEDELPPGNQDGVTYTIHDDNDGATIADEVYKNIKLSEITAATFAGSLLCDVAVTDEATADPAPAAFTNLEDGSDDEVADTDYQTALNEAAVEGAGNILFLDEYNPTRNDYLKVHAAATQDKLVLLAGESEDQTIAQVVTEVADYRDSDGRLVYCYPWVETTIGSSSQMTSPASWLAALISQIGPHIDPAFSKNTQFLAGMTGLSQTLIRSDYITLKEAGICAFERDPDIGFKVKSGIVTQITDSSKIMIMRRRMADYLTYSAAKFMKNYQNAINSAANRKLVSAALLNFVQSQESLGILPADSDVKDGLAKLVDTEVLNTNESIAQGFFKILWKQRIFSSMRFIVIQAEIGESVVVTAT